MTFTLQELAAMCGGELTGNPAQEIKGAASLAEAVAGEVTFFADPRYAALLRKTQASAVFVSLGELVFRLRRRLHLLRAFPSRHRE